jgi:hypothetical protein
MTQATGQVSGQAGQRTTLLRGLSIFVRPSAGQYTSRTCPDKCPFCPDLSGGNCTPRTTALGGKVSEIARAEGTPVQVFVRSRLFDLGKESLIGESAENAGLDDASGFRKHPRHSPKSPSGRFGFERAVKSFFRGVARALPVDVADDRLVSPVVTLNVNAGTARFRQLSEEMRKT